MLPLTDNPIRRGAVLQLPTGGGAQVEQELADVALRTVQQRMKFVTKMA